jgi:hypothetical protein
MDKLKEDYIDTKRKISEKMETMREALEISQFTEISESLATNYNKHMKCAKVRMNRSCHWWQFRRFFKVFYCNESLHLQMNLA